MISSERTVHRLFTDGILIAFSSAYAYLIAYTYECGYCVYFGIPIDLISPNTSTILVSGIAIGWVLFASYGYLGFSVPFFRAATDNTHQNDGTRMFFRINGAILAAGILIIMSYGFTILHFCIFVISVIFINIIFFWGAFIPKKGKSFEDRLQEIHDIQTKDPFHVTDILVEQLGRKNVLTGIMFVLILGLAFIVGNGNASQQTKFLISDENPNFVLLRTYGDLMIFKSIEKKDAKIGEENMKLGDKIMLLKASPGLQLTFTQAQVGPL